MVLSSSTRAQERPQPWLHTRRVQRGQLREAVSQTRHPRQGRASFHLVASYCQNNHLQASKNKSTDDKLCMISNFFNKILYINFILLFKWSLS